MASNRSSILSGLSAAALVAALVVSAAGSAVAQRTDQRGSMCFATAYVYNAAAAKRYVATCSIFLALDANNRRVRSRARAHAIRARAYEFQRRYAEAAAGYATAARLLKTINPSQAATHRGLRDDALAKVPRKR